MDVAELINLNGEKQEINAADYEKKIRYEKLSCPCCKEEVYWNDGRATRKNGEKRKKYFKHYNGTESVECENYCSNIVQNQKISPYERVGLPLYLLEECNSFSLNIGLYGISESTLQEAIDSNLSVRIWSNKTVVGTKKIDSVNIEPEIMHYIQVNACSNTYNLEFYPTHIPDEIRKKWIEDVNGIGENGAVFEYSQYGGKKVNSTDGLVTNTDYYCMLTDAVLNYDDYPSITFERVGEIAFSNSREYLVRKINIKEKNRDSLYFCKKFGMELSYSTQQLIPLWPPCKVNDQELIFIAQEKRFFILKSDDKEKQTVYSQESQRMVDSQPLSENKLILKIQGSPKEFLSISNPVSPFTYILLSEKLNSNKRAIALASQDISDSVVRIDSSAKVKMKIVRFKGNLPSNVTIIKQELIEIEKPKKNERIEILHGLDRLLIITNEEEDTSNAEEIDEYLFKMLNCTNANLISVPVSLKWIMLELRYCLKTYCHLQNITSVD